ncbi:MAG: N-acetyltransferase [Deltaproteobacteria bacterium CG_4_9_14_3_um_filter_63_12]|nr:MAG: N-acetyltransferase [Deltaproteobacteria bacterium CG_4_9_14_3_um_filter_63_12]
MNTFSHETAVIDDGATIGEGTKIWHFSHVMGGAVIGKGCNLGQNVFVADGVVIGDGCKLQNNVSVYRGVILEDDVFCGPSVVFTNVRTPRAAFPRGVEEYAETRIGHGATLGANATVLCGHTVGPWAFVGAGAVVTHDVPAYALVLGNPARQTGWVCVCGVVLGTESEPRFECDECGAIYRLHALDELVRA